MDFLKKLLHHDVYADINAMVHLPLVERVWRGRRVILSVFLGVLLMFLGSWIASLSKNFDHEDLLHRTMDTFGYFIHAIGTLPCLRYFEPLWKLLFAVETT